MLLLSSQSLSIFLLDIKRTFSFIYIFFFSIIYDSLWPMGIVINGPMANNFKLKGVNLTDGTADTVLSAQGCYPAVV